MCALIVHIITREFYLDQGTWILLHLYIKIFIITLWRLANFPPSRVARKCFRLIILCWPTNIPHKIRWELMHRSGPFHFTYSCGHESEWVMVSGLFNSKDYPVSDELTLVLQPKDYPFSCRGRNVLSEDTITQGFTHMFLLTFRSHNDLVAYTNHPSHLEYAEKFTAAIDKVLLFDFPPILVKPSAWKETYIYILRLLRGVSWSGKFVVVLCSSDRCCVLI